VAYGARLEIVLGVKTLAGSNPASSATASRDTRFRGHGDRCGAPQLASGAQLGAQSAFSGGYGATYRGAFVPAVACRVSPDQISHLRRDGG
jgi:hypothetical protein